MTDNSNIRMTTRNLTESFVFMRNNSIQNRHYYDDHGSDKTALISKRQNDSDVEMGHQEEIPAEYTNISNALQNEFGKIQSKMKSLISLHDRHLNRARLDDNIDEDREIETQTRDLTQVFVEAHRKLSQLVAAGRRFRLAGGSRSVFANNVQSNHARTLQDLSVAFRRAQSQYLTKLKSRDERLKAFFDIPLESTSYDGDFAEDSDGFTTGFDHHRVSLTRQTQLTEENTRVVLEREKEINQICKSIQELNEIFRDVAQMVTVQGSVVDRIDNNIEQTHFKVKKGLSELQKAHKIQKKNRKMLIIIVLGIIVVILSAIMIFTKLR